MRVLELSDREEAAAYCGKLFRRWGWEVLKVESPARRAPRPPLDIYLNGGKQRVRLDARNGRDRDTLAALAASADVLVTDYSARDVDELGLMSLGGARSPRVKVSVTPFGRSGPYRDYKATAATLLALGGYTWLMGDPGRAPLTMPGNYPYYQAGTFAYLSALAASMSTTPDPVEIEVSVLECLTSLHQFTDTMYNSGGLVRSRHGNRWENLEPTTLLPCCDGWYGVNILANFWASFAMMIGRPDLVGEGPLATNQGRMEHQDEVEDIITKALWDLPRKQVFKQGQEVWRVPIGYAASLGDLLDDPHLNERGFWRDVRLPGGAGSRALRTPGSPFIVVGQAPGAEQPPQAATAPQGVWAAASPAPARLPDPDRHSATTPLAGVRVLDMTRIWSGPSATRILADLGAEVIKIEAQDGRGGAGGPRGSAAGGTVVPERHWNKQPLFNKLNRNKKSIAIDLKAPAGRELFLRLVAKSDIVIENFSARAMPGLGLAYDDLKKANERIIYLAMPAYGQFGPYRDYIGLGPSIEPITGMTAVMGYSDDEPRVTSKAVTDPIAGTTTAAAVLTALERRLHTGRGCLIDLSQHETGVAFMGEYFIEAQLSGHEPARLGNAHPEYAPHGVYRCAGDDRWIALAARGQGEWQALCEVLTLGSAASDPRFVTPEARLQNRAALDAEIEKATSRHENRALEQALQARGVPAGSILTPPEWLGDVHLAERGYFVELLHREAGPGVWDGSPLVFNSARGYETWVPAPCLGEDARLLLRSILGLSDAEIDSLFAAGILADTPPARVPAL